MNETPARLRAEIDAMAVPELLALARTGQWSIHPLRAALDTPERLAAARATIADCERDEPRPEAGARSQEELRPAIAARRIERLALAWQRLGGGHELLFHVRGEPRAGEGRRIARTHVALPRIAIDPSPNVPRAPYLEHPVSPGEAARFAIVLPVMRWCVALGEASTRALDALGQPTAAQWQQAELQREPPRRRAVWRIHRDDGARTLVRMVSLASVHVLHDIGGRGEVARLGVPAAEVHHEGWSLLETAAIGELAWRLACERDARVQPPIRPVGSRMLPSPAVIGRRYRELDDPFAPLLAILRLGCRLHAFSCEATTFELVPLRLR